MSSGGENSGGGGGGSEGAAVQVLTRAVQLDKEKKFAEAVTCYEQGIRLLLQAAKGVCRESNGLCMDKCVYLCVREINLLGMLVYS